MRQSGRVALGGSIGALSLMFMLLTFFPMGTYALPAIAGAVLIPVVIETGARMGWMVYAAVALLSMLISPDLEAKFLFMSFFGYYPVLKSQLEQIHKRWLEWFIKFSLFNVTMVASYVLMLFLFNLDMETFIVNGVNMAFFFLLAGNVIFLIYDFALTNVISGYLRVLHPKFSHIFHIHRR